MSSDRKSWVGTDSRVPIAAGGDLREGHQVQSQLQGQHCCCIWVKPFSCHRETALVHLCWSLVLSLTCPTQRRTAGARLITSCLETRGGALHILYSKDKYYILLLAGSARNPVHRTSAQARASSLWVLFRTMLLRGRGQSIPLPAPTQPPQQRRKLALTAKALSGSWSRSNKSARDQLILLQVYRHNHPPPNM